MLLHAHNAVHWFINDFTSRIIAETGIPSDRFHLGKLIYWGMKEDPTFVSQTDGITGESETNESALKRSIQCAVSFKNIGLTQADTIVLMGPNHIHLAIPLYAALFIGVKVALIDSTLDVNELKDSFILNEPKLIFCQSEKASAIQKALLGTDLKSDVVTFDRCSVYTNFSDFIKQYSDEVSVNNFKPSDIDPENNIALLVPTSGTTALPRSIAVTHKNWATSLPYIWINFSNFPTPTKMAMVVSPLHWLSAGFHFLLSPVLKYHRLQSSKSITQDVFYEIVKKYRPTYMAISPMLMSLLLKGNNTERCDITSFETIIIGGSPVPENLIETIKKISPATNVSQCYGLTEIGGFGFHQVDAQVGSVGRPLGNLDYRLVSTETKKDIYKPNIQGELWVRGPSVCKGYYKNPEDTATALVDDGWFRTGDIFYRDDQWNFYFVERYKLFIKYNGYEVSPLELETVIKQNVGVEDTAVTSIMDNNCVNLVVACIVRKPGSTVTAQEIKDLVKDSLADWKQLRGGVIFMNDLPMTVTTKVDRRKLKELALKMNRE